MLKVRDFKRAFWQLGRDQREALILIGASGMSYEEAAAICQCPVGTVKSRVSRARQQLMRPVSDGRPEPADGERAFPPTDGDGLHGDGAPPRQRPAASPGADRRRAAPRRAKARRNRTALRSAE
jgi:hypothetical protein